MIIFDKILVILAILLAVFLWTSCIVGIIGSFIAENIKYKRKDYIYFPVMKKRKILFKDRIYKLKYRALCISNVPESLQELLRNNIEVPLLNAAKLAVKDKELSALYMSYNSYIDVIYNDLKIELNRCIEDEQIEKEMFQKLQSKMRVVEDAAKNVYDVINDKDKEICEFKRDERNAKLSLVSDQEIFSNLKNMNKIYDQEYGDMSDLIDVYDSSDKGEKQYIPSPMSGRIIEIMVEIGDKVKKGQPLCILESCKIEDEIVAPCKGTVSQILITKGANVDENDYLCEIIRHNRG